MDSHTEQVKQTAAEENAQYNKDVRQHIRDIAVSFGIAAGNTIRFGTFNFNEAGGIESGRKVLTDSWADVAGNICAFTEFLDAN